VEGAHSSLSNSHCLEKKEMTCESIDLNMNMDELDFITSQYQEQLNTHKNIAKLCYFKYKSAKNRCSKLEEDLNFIEMLKQQLISKESGNEEEWLVPLPQSTTNTIQRMRRKYASLIQKATNL